MATLKQSCRVRAPTGPLSFSSADRRLVHDQMQLQRKEQTCPEVPRTSITRKRQKDHRAEGRPPTLVPRQNSHSCGLAPQPHDRTSLQRGYQRIPRSMANPRPGPVDLQHHPRRRLPVACLGTNLAWHYPMGTMAAQHRGPLHRRQRAGHARGGR